MFELLSKETDLQMMMKCLKPPLPPPTAHVTNAPTTPVRPPSTTSTSTLSPADSRTCPPSPIPTTSYAKYVHLYAIKYHFMNQESFGILHFTYIQIKYR